MIYSKTLLKKLQSKSHPYFNSYLKKVETSPDLAKGTTLVSNRQVNLFQSDKNSLHFENNVVVLKNSEFLLNRIALNNRSLKETQYKTDNTPKKEENMINTKKVSALRNVNSSLLLPPAGVNTALSSLVLKDPKDGMQNNLVKAMVFNQELYRKDKNNYYNSYKNQIHNYIIEKYKNMDSFANLQGFIPSFLNPKSNLSQNRQQAYCVGEGKVDISNTNTNIYTKKIIIKNLLDQLSALIRKLENKEYLIKENSPINKETLNTNSKNNGNLTLISYTKGWNKKVDKIELDNIKKGSLLPENFVNYIIRNKASGIKGTIPVKQSSSQVSTGKERVASLREYLNLISNTKIAVNLAIPSNKNSLLSPPMNSSSKRIANSTDNMFDIFGALTRSETKPSGAGYLSSNLGLGEDQSKSKGLLFNYNKIISYNFLNSVNNTVQDQKSKTETGLQDRINKKELIEDLYKLLFYYFKSIYCLIGKPVIQFSPEKITINLFYFLNIPKRKVFRLFAIHNILKYKEEYIRRLSQKRHQRFVNKIKKQNRNSSVFTPISKINLLKQNTKKGYSGTFNKYNNIRLPFIKFRYFRAISRLKSKPEKIRELLFNLRESNLAKVFFNKFKIISNFLSNKFNKPIEFNLIRLHKPYLDSNILVNLLQLIVKNKKRKPRVAINKIYNKTKVSANKLSVINALYKKKANSKGVVYNKPSYLSGLSIYINGRLMREPILPRITTKKFESGASATGKVNFLDVSTITKKNRKGAYTIKIKTGQNLY